jgi:hypothetical protein
VLNGSRKNDYYDTVAYQAHDRILRREVLAIAEMNLNPPELHQSRSSLSIRQGLSTIFDCQSFGMPEAVIPMSERLCAANNDQKTGCVQS